MDYLGGMSLVNYSRWGLRLAAVAVSCCTVGATALAGSPPAGAAVAATGGASTPAGAAVGATGPVLKLVAAQNRITVPRYGREVYMDPGIYVASFGSSLVLDVQRASYTKPIGITQIIHLPGGGTEVRRLPGWVLHGFLGLRDFLRMRVVNSRGTTVALRQVTFCPDGYDPERASPNSPANSPYPIQCASGDPFPKGDVWGIAKGWADDPVEESGTSIRLRLGTYQVTETVTRQYRRLFDISARAASATVTTRVVNGQGCCGPVCCGPVCCGPVPIPTRKAGPRVKALASAPNVPYLRHPPRSVLPDLVPLPSWGISLSHSRATKKKPVTYQLNFGATVWIGGNSPLDVEGFRSHGSPIMKAYQYFWQNGHVIGRARAGTMGFDSQHGHHHWHFEQFAQYRLLNAAKTVALRSRKVGFCVAPTDSVDLVLPHASWQVPDTGFSGACGSPTALWVREMLPVGWGDTYFQTVAGQSFDITNLPNGTYYIEVIANPERVLHETTTGNDISLRRVILGGTAGHRTLRVPAWHGLDPEGLGEQ